MDQSDSRRIAARDKLFILLVVAGIVFAYREVFSNGFTNWDDPTFILHNSALQELSLENIARIFSPAGGMLKAETLYYPLVYVSYAIEHYFFGFDPLVFHTTSLLLHIANTLLFCAFLWMLTGERVLALAGAALFALHPIQVEAVAWAMGRKDPLCTFFCLWCLVGYLQYTRSRNGVVYVASLLALVCGALSKPAAIVVPVVLFLCDFLANREVTKRSVLEKVPFVLVGFGFALQSVFYVGTATAGIDVSPAEVAAMPLYVPWIIMMYVKNLLYPFELAALYPSPANFPLNVEVIVSTLLFALILVAVMASLRRTRVVVFGFAVSFVLISPTFILVPKLNDFIVADHYFYFPAIGVYFLAGAGINWVHHRVGAGQTRRAGWVLLCVLAVVLCETTAAQTKTWRDSISLWSNQIEKYPDTMPPIAYYNRGSAYRQLGKLEEAVADMSTAVEMFPRYSDAFRSRGGLYFETCCDVDEPERSVVRLGLAVADYNRVLELNPRDVSAYVGRKAALERLSAVMEELRL